MAKSKIEKWVIIIGLSGIVAIVIAGLFSIYWDREQQRCPCPCPTPEVRVIPPRPMYSPMGLPTWENKHPAYELTHPRLVP